MGFAKYFLCDYEHVSRHSMSPGTTRKKTQNTKNKVTLIQ